MPINPYALKPFPEAIEYLRQKTNMDTDRWEDAADAAIQDARFTVAGAKGRLLQQLREITERQIATGVSREEFLRDFDRIVAEHGWDYTGDRDWRSALILMTNLRNAYGEGRCQQMSDPEVLKLRPYRMWVHGDSIVPRPHHLAMDGRVFRADHPIAQIRLPWGFGCKCTWVSLSEADVRARGLQVDDKTQLGDPIKYIDKKGRERFEILEPDRGFGSPCKFETPEERQQRLQKARLDAIRDLPPSLIGFALMAVFGAGTIAVMAGVGLTKTAEEIINIDDAVEEPDLRVLHGLAVSSPIIPIPALMHAAQYSANEASRRIRQQAYHEVAEYLRDRIDREKLDRARQIIQANKHKQLNVVIDGAGDEGAEMALGIAQSLKKRGLPGDIFIIPNKMRDVFELVLEELKTNDPIAYAYIQQGFIIAHNLGIEIKSPEDLLKIPDPFIFPIRLALKNAVIKLTQQSFDTSLAHIEKIVDLIIENEAGHINFLGYSAGSIVAEDVVAVLAELGLPVDNVVTWGGMNLPLVSKTQTVVRRYVSKADYVDKVFGLPDQSEFDRVFEDVIHSPLGKSNREKLKSFPLNKKVLNQTVEDLNRGLLEPPMPSLDLTLVKQPHAGESIDINSATTRELADIFDLDLERAIKIQNRIRKFGGLRHPADLLQLGELGTEIIENLPPEQISEIKQAPITKIPSRQEIELLRLNAKEQLPFQVSIRTNQYPKKLAGTIDINPPPGRNFTKSEIETIKKWLRDNGYEVPVAANDRAFEDGFRFLKKIDTSPTEAAIAVQSFPQKLRGEANLLQSQISRINQEIADLEALKQKSIDQAMERLGIDNEDNPYIRDIKNRFDKQIAGKIHASQKLQQQAEQYLAQAEQAEMLGKPVQQALAITTQEELNIAVPNPDLQITVINTAQEIANRNQRLTKAIEDLPKIKNEIQVYERAINDLETVQQLAKATDSEIKRLNKQKTEITKTIRSVEELLNQQGLDPEGITKNSKIIATSREKLAQIDAQLLSLTEAKNQYDAQIASIKPFADKAKQQVKKLKERADYLEYVQIPGDYRFIEENLQKLRAIDNLRSADPEATERLPRQNPIVPPQPKRERTFPERSFVRRAWAEKYAEKTGGQILVDRDPSGKAIYRVVARSD